MVRQRPARTAVLVFADATSNDLARRGWGGALAPLLRLPRFAARGVPGCDVHLFTNERSGERPSRDRVHPQHGDTFAERLKNAVDALASLGYERVVIVGRDCPQLTRSDVRVAAASLDRHRLVLGPDHRGGCYLIALHTADRTLLADIPWQRNADCAALRDAFGADRTRMLAVKRDLDDAADLRLHCAESESWATRFKRLLFALPAPFVLSDSIPPILPIDSRRMRWQRPPPPSLLRILHCAA